MKHVRIFSHEMFGQIRTMTDEKGETFFVGKDVAEALGYKNSRDALTKHVDEEDKTTVAICDTGSNYKSKVVIINESGLYSLVLSSKLEQAKAFKRWVTSEVLPQIRKTGGYIPTHDGEGRQLTDLEIMALALQIQQKTLEGFARLPEEFTNDDVMRCFNFSSDSSARSKTSRLIRDHLIEKVREEKGSAKALFRKTGTIIL